MRWWRWRPRRARKPGQVRAANQADVDHLKEFTRTRPGVEAFLEPRTTVTECTVILVAASGEWTRRRVPGEREARDLANKWGIPVYDAGVVGYPDRKRAWDRARSQESPKPRGPDPAG